MNTKAAILGAFIGDAMALGPHWMYDTKDLKTKFGDITTITAPLADSYHPNKKAGEFTHYGDQLFMILTSVSKQKKIDLPDIQKNFVSLFNGYNDYVDHATKETLANYMNGSFKGSTSEDLSAASRIACALLVSHSAQTLADNAQTLATITHNSESVILATQFFSQVVWEVLEGARPSDVITTCSAQYPAIKRMIDAGFSASTTDTVTATSELGSSCAVSESLSATVQAIVAHENDFEKAICQTVQAGGDSSARAMLVGLVLGAYLGEKALPENWREAMTKESEIVSLITLL
ncbi:MAG: ADP-ribosylglycohydrolase [Candidatus Woesearchaeota archaeon]|jgi:ADP-ribosylglycohydrolase